MTDDSFSLSGLLHGLERLSYAPKFHHLRYKPTLEYIPISTQTRLACQMDAIHTNTTLYQFSMSKMQGLYHFSVLIIWVWYLPENITNTVGEDVYWENLTKNWHVGIGNERHAYFTQRVSGSRSHKKLSIHLPSKPGCRLIGCGLFFSLPGRTWHVLA